MKIKVSVRENSTLFEIISQMASISSSKVKRLIKNREAKVNGERVSENVSLKLGDEVEVFIPESFLTDEPEPTIIYEDKNICIVDKPILTEVEPTLTEKLSKRYGFVKPVHRLDRNTTGLVVFALNEMSYKLLLEAFRARKVEKHYEALIKGRIDSGIYTAYLRKDSAKAICLISPVPKKGYIKIVTGIDEIERKNELTLLDIKLITGRTHQIRAHLAFLGHPVLGDGKYGDGDINKKYSFKHQQLCAYKLIFHGLQGEMSYLNEKIFQLKQNLLTKTD